MLSLSFWQIHLLWVVSAAEPWWGGEGRSSVFSLLLSHSLSYPKGYQVSHQNATTHRDGYLNQQQSNSVAGTLNHIWNDGARCKSCFSMSRCNRKTLSLCELLICPDGRSPQFNLYPAAPNKYVNAATSAQINLHCSSVLISARKNAYGEQA